MCEARHLRCDIGFGIRRKRNCKTGARHAEHIIEYFDADFDSSKSASKANCELPYRKTCPDVKKWLERVKPFWRSNLQVVNLISRSVFEADDVAPISAAADSIRAFSPASTKHVDGVQGMEDLQTFAENDGIHITPSNKWLLWRDFSLMV
ncbi:hypothetical protein K503DRAFT_783986 [Rhizopogon vinicolor AM-OR11-026]|uniref:Uncharacterized protein n=1 Tax=Rhizopogon vinicolor AM-OR11-026 TaxID=1314800 RepID=A0A1B7MWJ4_9AGAM|nr:hypothetical protein K503DRAFT_783986 [Rhizopogon vinicolor AM-OR11-026]